MYTKYTTIVGSPPKPNAGGESSCEYSQINISRTNIEYTMCEVLNNL